MAILTKNDYIAAPKQNIPYSKVTSRTTIAAIPFSTFDLTGQPGNGVLAGTSVTAGVVPTDATAGCPEIDAFGAGATGYITRLSYKSSVASNLDIFDMLFKAGAYPFNASQTLSSQPSYSSRVPSGTDYKGTQIWFEAVTAFTGNPVVTITYTNQAGTAARTSGAISFASAPTVGRMLQIPLQAGDTGVQKIESVTATTATVGTFNILVLRPLVSTRVGAANDGGIQDLFRTGMPQVFADSALFLQLTADSTTSGVPNLQLQVANK